MISLSAHTAPPASASASADSHHVSGLDALEARLREDLGWLELPAPSWVPARHVDAQRVLDVAIIGGGMAGLAASAELRLLGIDNQQVFDQAREGHEGPWVTYARMQTLRSPKQLTGPALRLPALTFRAWYEAQFGPDAWSALYKIPREQWMTYLRWYRRVLALPVRNETRVVAVRPRDDGLIALDLESLSTDATDVSLRETVLARHVVLATGREGLGGAFIPPSASSLPAHLHAHSSADIDFAALRGRRVGVVGASASAFDNAASALEAGAARVDLFIRRTDIPRTNKLTGIGSPGLVHGFAGLPDAWKWRFLHYSAETQTPPPRDSVLRVSRHSHAHFHLGSPLARVTCRGTPHGDVAVVETPKGRYELDYLIFATGFHSELDTRAVFAAIAPHIRRWRDRFTPADDLSNKELAAAPDLDRNFAFQMRGVGADARVDVGGDLPTDVQAETQAEALKSALGRIHCFNHAASLSHGKVAGDIPAISDGAQRLARAIAAMLFDADRDTHYAALQAFDTAELNGDEWVDADVDADTNVDTVARLADLAPGGAVAALRAARADATRFTQGSHDALFSSDDVPDLTLEERLYAAWYAARLSRASAAAAMYRDRLLDHTADAATAIALIEQIDAQYKHDAQNANGPSPSSTAQTARLPTRLQAILTQTHTLITRPADATCTDLATLTHAGLSTRAIVALAQLVAFVAYQIRVVAALSALDALENPT